MDPFEKYIRDNRDQLDFDEPDTEIIWQGVHEDLKNNTSRFRIWGVAASIAILIGCGYLWLQRNNNEVINSPNSIAEIAPELAEEENKLKSLVSEKEETIDLDKIKKEDYQEIFLELELLDKINQEYRNDLPNYGNKDRLVQTLLKYYERKIKILERLSKEIEKKEYHENRNKETQL